jgi:hypothetical protein
MQHRQNGHSQEAAAAKAGISERSGRRIEHAGGHRPANPRNWRTREDPLDAVWESELVPYLKLDSGISPTTLFEYLLETYPLQYDQKILRTLQRRVKQWRALNGPAKDVIFRQQAVIAQQGFSDFTHPDTAVTINGEPFKHILYQFRLAYSGWRSVTIVQGGESYVALACGLQRALKQAGGSPKEHRTDSLSAARNNRQNVWTDSYSELCDHYNMQPTRNNPGISRENGVVECANGSLKRRISQQCKLRGHCDFDSIEAYQSFIDKEADKLNRRTQSRIDEERLALRPLPEFTTADYQTLNVKVTSSSTIEIRRVLYSVPSRLIGERIQVRLHHDKLALYVGQQWALELTRIYPTAEQGRTRKIDFRHLIGSLVTKPQAFRYSQLRDDILPDDNYRSLWQLTDKHFDAREACKWMVTVLRVALDHDDVVLLGQDLLAAAERGHFATITQLQDRYRASEQQSRLHNAPAPEQHALSGYDAILKLTAPQAAANEDDRKGVMF